MELYVLRDDHAENIYWSADQSRPLDLVKGREFSLFVIFITSNQVRVTSKPNKDLSFLPTWIMQLTPSSVVLLLFFLIIPDTP